MRVIIAPNVQKLKEKKNINGLIKALTYKSFIGLPGDWAVRWEAALLLGQIGDPRAILPLCKALRDGHARVSEESSNSLVKIGDDRAIEPLCIALRDKNSWVRCQAAWALGKIGKSSVIEPLCNAIKDGNRDVRQAVVIALGDIADARAVEYLSAALQDPDSIVREEATFVLERLGIPEGEQIHIWYHIAKKNFKQVVCYKENAVQPLCSLINDWDIALRLGAIRALGEIADARAIKHLCIAFQDKCDRVRQEAAVALGKIGAPITVELLCGAIKDKSCEVVKAATDALVMIGSPSVNQLCGILKHDDLFVRRNAAEALGKINDVRALVPLIEALNDSDSYVRWCAAKSLVKLYEGGQIDEAGKKMILMRKTIIKHTHFDYLGRVISHEDSGVEYNF